MTSEVMTEQTLFTHDYIFHVSEKEINAAIYDLGTAFDRIDDNGLWSDRSHQSKECSCYVFNFLLSIEFVDDCDHFMSQIGKAYFEALFIHQDQAVADEYLRTALLKNPAVNLIGQVFYGRGKILVEQLRVLLNYHRASECEVVYSDVISILTLLNRFGITVYDKRNKGFVVKEPANTDTLITQYYVNPSTPFSNIYNMRRVLRASSGDVFWIDKHFRKEGFEIIIDGLANDGVSTITIISGADNCTQSAQTDYRALQTELLERNVTLSWRIIDDDTFKSKWHDRWLISDTTCYNIPPVLSIIRGQRSDIIQTKMTLDIQPFFDASVSIETRT